VIEHIHDLSDPRVEPYRNLKDRELAAMGELFIAEGEHLVRRLVDSDYPVVSVLLSDRRADQIAPTIRDEVPCYVVPDAVMHQIIGYHFHSGVIGCGRRKPRATIDQVVKRDTEKLTLVICPEIANAENMGAMIRLCAGFGVDALLLGERSCDPFWRQSIRVSMGNIFRLPLVRSDDLRRDLKRLREEWGVELAATVLDESAQPLGAFSRGENLGILFGNEAQGLDADVVAMCDHQITIPMKLGTDSLNVSVAAGIFLYELTK
jgi:tRNA G18 (ribose-2'-O)-methylase SpoU